jgi:hypothetical protein
VDELERTRICDSSAERIVDVTLKVSKLSYIVAAS